MLQPGIPFWLGTGSSLLSGESFEDALHEGVKGALTGAGIGAITGAASGFNMLGIIK